VSGKYESIVARRSLIIGEIARQRLSLAQQAESLAAPLVLVDQGLGVLRYVRRHPVLAAAAVALVLALRPGAREGTWLGRGLLAWQLVARFNSIRARNVCWRTD